MLKKKSGFLINVSEIIKEWNVL